MIPYQNHSGSLCVACFLQSLVFATSSSSSKTPQNKKQCYFCAGDMHPGGKKECPAKIASAGVVEKKISQSMQIVITIFDSGNS